MNIIFAGTNGVGKTSMYKSIYYNENKDEINVYDNTEKFKQVIDLRDVNISWKDKNMPGWTDDLLDEQLLNKLYLIAILLWKNTIYI
ncbi:hypothetical protein [Clostridium estertheticum]|uniref:hypothetical protein n=1 Tax=Clostridium estertheticum TaxID=238834 RepID=UPI001CF1247E|nr:hypothetical protein [Clostridium estertheticum]MCB2339016.1 hypothetical protein [Clostridium estertheticum]